MGPRQEASDVGCVTVSPDGRFAVTSGFGGVLRVWDMQTIELARAWFSLGYFAQARFSADSKDLAPSNKAHSPLLEGQ